MKTFFKVLPIWMLLFESSNAMYSNSDLSIGVDPKAASVCMRLLPGTESVEMPMTRTITGQLVVSMPAKRMFSLFMSDSALEARVLNLLATLRTERFGINPSIEFVLKEDSIECFNELFAELGSVVFDILPLCSDDQIERIVRQLKLCSGTSAQTAYSACSEFSQRSESEISEIERYFNNVSEKLEILAKMIQKK